jgi:hypothetical protein
MPHIVLTEEQMRVVRAGGGPIDIRDPEGRPLACFEPLTPLDQELLEKARLSRARGEPGVPAAEVQAHLRRLAEIRRDRGMDAASLQDLLRRLQAGEEV